MSDTTPDVTVSGDATNGYIVEVYDTNHVEVFTLNAADDAAAKARALELFAEQPPIADTSVDHVRLASIELAMAQMFKRMDHMWNHLNPPAMKDEQPACPVAGHSVVAEIADMIHDPQGEA